MRKKFLIILNKKLTKSIARRIYDIFGPVWHPKSPI